MKLTRVLLMLAALAVLGGCASSTPRMAEVRAFAAQAPKLGAYHELTERYRATYQREQPFLSAAADARERELDRQRQPACDDFVKLQYGVQAYMQALGRLAGDGQYDLEDQVKAMAGGIKAWPDNGIDDRHVNAYAGLARLLARAITRPLQENRGAAADARRPATGAGTAGRDAHAAAPVRQNQRQRGENRARHAGDGNPLPRPGRDRLLMALAKSQQHDKQAEYHLIGLRITLAENNLAAIEQSYRALLDQIPPQP